MNMIADITKEYISLPELTTFTSGQSLLTEMKTETGIDFSLNLTLAFNTLTILRLLRQFLAINTLPDITRRILNLPDPEREIPPEELENIMLLLNSFLVVFAKILWGGSSEELEDDIRNLRDKFQPLNEYISGMQEIHSNYGGDPKILFTLSGYLLDFHKNNKQPIASDNLADHFRQHTYLKGISISRLRTFTSQSTDHCVVLSANASSGLVEAVIISYYMNTYLGIRTKVNPIFFNKYRNKLYVNISPNISDNEIIQAFKEGKDIQKFPPHPRGIIRDIVIPESGVVNIVQPLKLESTNLDHLIVIPFDDMIPGSSGNSAVVGREATRRKYGIKRMLMSPAYRRATSYMNLGIEPQPKIDYSQVNDPIGY